MCLLLLFSFRNTTTLKHLGAKSPPPTPSTIITIFSTITRHENACPTRYFPQKAAFPRRIRFGNAHPLPNFQMFASMLIYIITYAILLLYFIAFAGRCLFFFIFFSFDRRYYYRWAPIIITTKVWKRRS